MVFAHAKRTAQRLGYRQMVIQADPNAAPFYLVAGAKPAGTEPSESIPGRQLLVLHIDLKNKVGAKFQMSGICGINRLNPNKGA